MAEIFTTRNGVKHIQLSATPGNQTEVTFHNDAHACNIEFFTAVDLLTSTAGQVSFTGADATPIGANKWRPVAPNTDWPFALRYPESEEALQSIYLSSTVASIYAVVTSFEAPQ